MSRVNWAERVEYEQGQVDHYRAELRKQMSSRSPRGQHLKTRLRQAESRLATARMKARQQAGER